MPAEIPGGFSSSLLPPSFPRGRSATVFSMVMRVASRGPHVAVCTRNASLRRSAR